ncbi:MAG: TetR/AcrR family transcriptional regulator; helix-turn-helix transcriptional regulator [Deltaproteobacteria bacterium]|nr:TetR/AcrR family transcriptional regulator; helix-turn-helix transcriptional regulator [Deltaproteobacteria bacterium]
MTAALELFCEHGYAATSTAKIAKAAGVAEGLIFHQFGTKDGLLLAVATRHQTFAGRVVGILRAEHGSARELLLAIAKGLADIDATERAFIGFMQAEAQINAPLRGRLQQGNAMMLGALVKILRTHVRRGELREDANLSVAVEGFFGGFLYFFGQHRDLSPRTWRRKAADFSLHWVDQCWRGLATAATLSEYSTE